MEHVSQYLAYLGEGSSKKQLEYVCFLYTLLYNSIYDWEQLERTFYEHFLMAPIIKIVSLNISQARPGRINFDYIVRFRETISQFLV